MRVFEPMAVYDINEERREKERKKETSNQDNVNHNNTLILTRKSIW